MVVDNDHRVSKISIKLAFLNKNKKMDHFERFICFATRSRYPYVELIIDDKWLSFTNGVIRLKPLKEISYDYDYANLGIVEVRDNDLYNAISFLKLQEGKKVNNFNKLFINFFKINIKTMDSWFDSELVTYVLRILKIKEVKFLNHHFTLPGDLAKIYNME